jgi:hypothetical protein
MSTLSIEKANEPVGLENVVQKIPSDRLKAVHDLQENAVVQPELNVPAVDELNDSPPQSLFESISEQLKSYGIQNAKVIQARFPLVQFEINLGDGPVKVDISHDNPAVAIAEIIRRELTRSWHLQFVRIVRVWASCRCITGTSFGLVPGIGWTTLCVHHLRKYPQEPLNDLIMSFFKEFACFNWKVNTVYLDDEEEIEPYEAEMKIIVAGVNVTSKVQTASLRLIQVEFERAARITSVNALYLELLCQKPTYEGQRFAEIIVNEELDITPFLWKFSKAFIPSAVHEDPRRFRLSIVEAKCRICIIMFLDQISRALDRNPVVMVLPGEKTKQNGIKRTNKSSNQGRKTKRQSTRQWF